MVILLLLKQLFGLLLLMSILVIIILQLPQVLPYLLMPIVQAPIHYTLIIMVELETPIQKR